MERNLEQLNELEADPRLDALLDEALAPDDPPTDLASRIVAATQDDLPAPGILARLGSRRFRLAAAIVLLTCEVGVVAVASSIAHEVRDTLVVKREMTHLAAYEPPVDLIDAELELLDRQLTAALAGRAWEGGWNEPDDLGIDDVYDISNEVVF